MIVSHRLSYARYEDGKNASTQTGLSFDKIGVDMPMSHMLLADIHESMGSVQDDDLYTHSCQASADL